jgi:uncharacterized protein
MKIKISNLSDGSHQFRFVEPVNTLGLESPFGGNIEVDVEINKVHNQLILDSSILVNAVYECDRCAASFYSPLRTEYKMVYMPGMEPLDTASDNIAYLSVEADSIDISSDVRDFTILAIPMKKLCSEECKGLCPRCGKNLNEGDCSCNIDENDVRWLPLMELKNKLNTN